MNHFLWEVILEEAFILAYEFLKYPGRYEFLHLKWTIAAISVSQIKYHIFDEWIFRDFISSYITADLFMKCLPNIAVLSWYAVKGLSSGEQARGISWQTQETRMRYGGGSFFRPE